jgi:hypothetical protein
MEGLCELDTSEKVPDSSTLGEFFYSFVYVMFTYNECLVFVSADFSKQFDEKCTTPDVQVNIFLSMNMDNTEVIVHQTKPVDTVKTKTDDKSGRLRHPADKGLC